MGSIGMKYFENSELIYASDILIVLAHVKSLFNDSCFLLPVATHATMKGKNSGHPGITYSVKLG